MCTCLEREYSELLFLLTCAYHVAVGRRTIMDQQTGILCRHLSLDSRIGNAGCLAADFLEVAVVPMEPSACVV